MRKIHTTCHFEWVKRATQWVARHSHSKNPLAKTALWAFCKKAKISIVILSVSEKSTEFKIRLKSATLHFKFMDTSFRSVWQRNKSIRQGLCRYDKKGSMTRFRGSLQVMTRNLSFWAFCKKGEKSIEFLVCSKSMTKISCIKKGGVFSTPRAAHKHARKLCDEF